MMMIMIIPMNLGWVGLTSGFILTGGHDEGNHHYSYSYEYMMGWTGQTLGSSNKKRYHNDDDGGDFEMHCHMMIIIPI